MDEDIVRLSNREARKILQQSQPISPVKPIPHPGGTYTHFLDKAINAGYNMMDLEETALQGGFEDTSFQRAKDYLGPKFITAATFGLIFGAVYKAIGYTPTAIEGGAITYFSFFAQSLFEREDQETTSNELLKKKLISAPIYLSGLIAGIESAYLLLDL